MATRAEIREPRVNDLWAFDRMRPADVAEVRATGFEPIESVVESWASSSEAWTLKLGGEVAGMFGVAPHPAETVLTPMSVIWLLTTDVVDRHPIEFVRLSKAWLARLSADHGALINFIDARHVRALAWARRVGFHVQPAVPFGKDGEPFHPIVYGGA